MNISYTRGPWTTKPEEVHKDYIRIRGTALGGRYKIANVDGAHCHDDKDVEEVRSNARIIAASPDLYEALMAFKEVADKIVDEQQKKGQLPERIKDLKSCCDLSRYVLNRIHGVEEPTPQPK